MNKKTSQLGMWQYLTYKACYRIILKFHVDNNNDTRITKVVIMNRLLCVRHFAVLYILFHLIYR